MAEVSSKLAGDGFAARAFYRLVKGLVVFLARSLLRVEYIGLEHVPRSGSFIIAPTHRSLLDIPVAAGVTSRRLRFMGKDALWKVPVFGRFLSALGGFPVTRGSADLEALKRCIGVLKNGEPLVLFPEGTRHEGPVIAELFDGAAFVAAKAEVQIVPVAISGTEISFPGSLKQIAKWRCTVIVGRPIGYSSNARQSRDEMAKLTGRLHGELQSLLDEANRRVSQRLK